MNERDNLLNSPIEADSITSEEYQLAIDRLRQFLQIDAYGIENLDGLVVAMGSMYDDLKTVIVAKGKIEEELVEISDFAESPFFDLIDAVDPSYIEGVYRWQTIERKVGEKSFRVFINEGNVEMTGYLGATSSDQNHRYFFSFGPYTSKSPEGGQNNPAPWMAYTPGDSYYPTLTGMNRSREYIRGFARVLQFGVYELTNVIGDSTDLPEVFKES